MPTGAIARAEGGASSRAGWQPLCTSSHDEKKSSGGLEPVAWKIAGLPTASEAGGVTFSV